MKIRLMFEPMHGYHTHIQVGYPGEHEKIVEY
jgi:hypothetical protein